MIYILLLLSIWNTGVENQKEFSNLTFLYEKIFQNEKSPKNKKKLKCRLAIEYQNYNEFKFSMKYLKSCKKLGPNYRELYYFMNIRAKFYLNNKKVINTINYFIKKYPNSTFLKEVEKFKLRYYFKYEKYKSSYFGYIKYKKENKLSNEELIFVDYIIRYSYSQFAKKDDKLLALLDTLNDKQFYLKENINKNILKINEYTQDDIEKFLKKYLKEKKYYKISKLLFLLRKFNENLFKESVNNENIKKILKNNKTNINFLVNIYHFNKKNWDLEKRESFLDNLLDKTEIISEKKDILYQKLILYKKYKKTKKRIETYKKMLEFKQSKRKKASYYLKIGIYSIDIKNEKEGIEYLNLIIKKYNRWYKEYSSAVFILFKLYRNKFLLSKTPEEKNDFLKKLEFIEKKMKRNIRLKDISYYYKYKDKRANEKEIVRIKKYFENKPYNFYSIMINKKTIDEKDGWKKWKDLVIYQKIPEKKLLSKNSRKNSIYRIGKIFKEYKDLFSSIKIIQNLQNLEETKLQEKIMINFYNELYKLNKKKKNLNEKELKQKEVLKKIKKNYYYHFLNYFIVNKNYRYSYLLMHRHFTYLKKDDFYKYYYHPFPYYDIINKEAQIFNINPLVVLSIIETESIFNPNAYSSVGAIGLMQIMPATGKAIANELKIKNYDLYLPKDNIKFGTYYIAELIKRFHYQLPFSAASYNGGPHNMKRWLDKHKSENLKLDEMIENIAFRETRYYAKKIIKLFAIYNKFYSNKNLLIPVNINHDNKKTINF